MGLWRRPSPVAGLGARGVLLILWGLALRDFLRLPEGAHGWTGWCLVAGVPALRAVKASALLFNARGPAAVAAISGDRAWRRIGLARSPVAIILAVLTWLA